MTYEEYITKTVAKFQIGADEVDLILANQAELIPNKAAPVDVKTAKLALCKEFATILPLANISEGGYSITWNYDAIKLWYSMTCKELGIKDVTKPKVTNKSNLW